MFRACTVLAYCTYEDASHIGATSAFSDGKV